MKSTNDVFDERTVTKDGVTYSYSVANEHAEQKVVILHGVSGGKEDMTIMGAATVKRGYATYLLDLPNHGLSSAMDVKDFDQLGVWLHQAIQALEITPDIVVGNSFGSAVCYNYAAQGFLPVHAQLILGCPTPDISFMTMTLGNMLVRLPHSMIRPFYNSRLLITARVRYLSRRNDESRVMLRQSEVRKIPTLDVLAATKMGHLVASHHPYEQRLLPEEIQRQIVVVIGDRDNVVTSRSISKLRRLLPYAKFDIVHGAGHILHFEAPEKVAGHVGVRA